VTPTLTGHYEYKFASFVMQGFFSDRPDEIRIGSLADLAGHLNREALDGWRVKTVHATAMEATAFLERWVERWVDASGEFIPPEDAPSFIAQSTAPAFVQQDSLAPTGHDYYRLPSAVAGNQKELCGACGEGRWAHRHEFLNVDRDDYCGECGELRSASIHGG
jgi:hypothetical protein